MDAAMDTQTLSPVETAKLENLEVVIESGLKEFLKVGNALFEIQQGKLYRATFGTFEDYCQDRWDLQKSHAYRLIDAAEVAADLSPNGGNQQQPKNERQVRPLTQLPREDRASAWREAVQTAPNGKVTAAHVEQVVKSRLPDYEPEADHKSNGHKKQSDDNQSKCDEETREIAETFAGRLAKVCDGGVYTLDTLAKAFGSGGNEPARLFIRQCDVSPAVKVTRTMGRKALMQYVFEKTNCVSGHARVRQLAKQIAEDSGATSKIKKAAEQILTLLGG